VNSSPADRGPTADVDLLCAEAIEQPHQYLARIRDRAPVVWSARHRAWMVLGHPELDAAFRSSALSTERMGAFRARLTGSRADALAAAIELLDGWMLFHDPPEHTRLRTPLQRQFTPKAVAPLADAITAACDQLLDAMAAAAATSNEPVDLVEAFAHPVPAAVIARLFGVPDHLRTWLTEWSSRFGVVVFGATGRPDYEAVARAAGVEFREHLGALLEQRRAEPRNDLVSLLATTAELSDTEVLGACSLLLFAGHDTTASLISTAALALIEHPDQHRRLIAEPHLHEPAVEEFLRYDGSAKAMMRLVAEPTELGGCTLLPGEAVFLTILAANRDPRVFDQPADLLLDRSPNPHLSFGHGTHFCLGASLARLELRIALPRLAARFPALRLAGPPVWKANISDRSAAALPVHLA